jgi:glucokinase
MTGDHRKSVGIDIGGTKTAVAAVDFSGRIHARHTFETASERGFTAGLTALTESIEDVLGGARWLPSELSGIGIGCTGPVNPLRGTIHNPFTLPGWEDAEIVTDLGKRFPVPVILENDADAAAFGEYRFGAGRNANPVVIVTLGTGIGGATILNGAIQRGVNGDHPELGHIPIVSEGPPCYCGINGCWESLASGTAIALAGKAFQFEDSRAVFAAMSHNENAAAIIKRAITSTTAAAWTLLHAILPERIIIGGGVGEAYFDLFAEPIREKIRVATQIPKNKVQVVKAELGLDAGVIGAAALAFQNTNP